MNWKKPIGYVLAGTVCLLMSFATLASSMLVLSSTRVGIEPGAVLAPETWLTIERGESVRLMTASGTIVQLDGPYSGTLEAYSTTRETALIGVISELVGQINAARSTPAYFRGPQGKASPWTIDPRRAEVFCVRADEVALWRQRARRLSRVALGEAGSGVTTRINWHAREHHLAWPASVGLTDGARYTVSVDGGSESEFSVRLLPATLPSPAHEIAWAAENGCTRQAQAELRTLMADNEAR